MRKKDDRSRALLLHFTAMTIRRSQGLLLTIIWPLLAMGQNTGLTQIKERELEAVREKISALKTSMDKRAADRDRITADLQEAEVQISEKRINLKDLERQRLFSERKKAQLDARLETQEAALAEEYRLLLKDPPAPGVGGPALAVGGLRYVTIFVDNLDEIVESCRAAGYTIAMEPQISPIFPNRIAFVEDPDGNALELFEPDPE